MRRRTRSAGVLVAGVPRLVAVRGGSSGGPWIQNFGNPSAGQTGGFSTGRNEVVGITSYGFVSTDPKIQGSSILDNRWVSLWNLMCASPGACTQTP